MLRVCSLCLVGVLVVGLSGCDQIKQMTQPAPAPTPVAQPEPAPEPAPPVAPVEPPPAVVETPVAPPEPVNVPPEVVWKERTGKYSDNGLEGPRRKYGIEFKLRFDIVKNPSNAVIKAELYDKDGNFVPLEFTFQENSAFFNQPYAGVDLGHRPYSIQLYYQFPGTDTWTKLEGRPQLFVE